MHLDERSERSSISGPFDEVAAITKVMLRAERAPSSFVDDDTEAQPSATAIVVRAVRPVSFTEGSRDTERTTTSRYSPFPSRARSTPVRAPEDDRHRADLHTTLLWALGLMTVLFLVTATMLCVVLSRVASHREGARPAQADEVR